MAKERDKKRQEQRPFLKNLLKEFDPVLESLCIPAKIDVTYGHPDYEFDLDRVTRKINTKDGKTHHVYFIIDKHKERVRGKSEPILTIDKEDDTTEAGVRRVEYRVYEEIDGSRTIEKFERIETILDKAESEGFAIHFRGDETEELANFLEIELSEENMQKRQDEIVRAKREREEKEKLARSLGETEVDLDEVQEVLNLLRDLSREEEERKKSDPSFEREITYIRSALDHPMNF